MNTFNTDFVYRAAEKQRKQSMDKCPDEIGDQWAGFFCLFAMMLWLFDLACWSAP